MNDENAPKRRGVPKEKGRAHNIPLKHRLFVDEYIKNGGNAVQAYMVCYPEAKYASAGANANRLLKYDGVKAMIDARLHEMLTPDLIKREIQRDILHGDKNQRTAALRLAAQVEAMVSERRINVEEQRRELGRVTYESYAEGVRKPNEA